ncbi:YbhB/YbcL family Raf kinase inhibitor-like protein [Thiohalorhabdus sp. Cl-TMA]|uniref:YbhB/YbcL family Raf kinase inhibitor-like protein n=1 Tax=Thiohalorhabdus methylotrophus TaxID=3242694 RepID=A0ABV4TUZ6_9GAMM
MSLTLMSGVFAHDHQIPVKYTCDGEDVSPPLEWAGIPDNTRSFALVCDDPDAPGGTFQHWAVYDIPPETTFLEEGFSSAGTPGRFPEGANDFGKTAYGGPCPPAGHGAHHYRFRLLALDVDHLDLPGKATMEEVEKTARAHMLAETELVGHYEREG